MSVRTSTCTTAKGNKKGDLKNCCKRSERTQEWAGDVVDGIIGNTTIYNPSGSHLDVCPGTLLGDKRYL